MISDFITSWPLFASTYVALLLLAVLLSLTGIPAVARDQLFAGAAVSQAAMLGIGLALLPGYTRWGADQPWLSHPLMPTLCGSALAALALATLEWRRDDHSSLEARTAWLYLAAGSLTIVVLFHTPVGLQEIHQRLASSVIGAEWLHVWLAGGLFAGGLIVMGLLGSRITLWMTDPMMAKVVGLKVGRYRLLYAVWLGSVLGFAIHTAGVLVAFGFLILPVLAAARLCRTMSLLPWIAILVAAGCVVVGIGFAHVFDLPLGPSSVATMVLAVAATRFRLRSRYTTPTA